MPDHNAGATGAEGSGGAAPTIIIPPGGNLHKFIERTEQLHDNYTREIGELRSANVALSQELRDAKAVVDEVRISYRALDERTRGDREKNWQPENTIEGRACDALGRAMWDALGYFRRGYRDLPSDYARRTGEAGPADQIEETSNIGGITVPTLTAQTIAYYEKSTGLARQLCFSGPMKSNQINDPAIDESGVPTVYYVNQGQRPTANSVVTFLTNKQLTAKTVMAVQLLEQEMLDDTGVTDFTGFWARIFMDQFRLKEDRAVFSETATDTNSAFTGAVQAVTAYSSGANLVTLAGTHFSSLTYDDLVIMQSIPAEGAQSAAVWVGSRSTLRWIQSLADGNQRPLISNMWQGMLPYPEPRPDGIQNRATVLLGAPYYITAAMPTDVSGASKVCLLYGDFAKGHYFFDRQKLDVGFSIDAAYGTGGVMFRMRERFATLNVLTAGFAGAKNHA